MSIRFSGSILLSICALPTPHSPNVGEEAYSEVRQRYSIWPMRLDTHEAAECVRPVA
jgi:hypothetical protein